MGVVQDQLEPLLAEYQKLGLAPQIGLGLVAFLVLSVILNVAKQILLPNPNEPPMVFHLFPLIGNTVEYGIDPPRFFQKMRAKVRCCLLPRRPCMRNRRSRLFWTRAHPK